MTIESRVRDILEDEPGQASTLDHLLAMLGDDLWNDADGYGRLRRLLRARPDAFDLVEPASPFENDALRDLQRAYERALHRDGARPAPRVGLAFRDARADPHGYGAHHGRARRTLVPRTIDACHGRQRALDIGQPETGIEATLRLADLSLLVLSRRARADPLLRGDLAEAVNQIDAARLKAAQKGPGPARPASSTSSSRRA